MEAAHPWCPCRATLQGDVWACRVIALPPSSPQRKTVTPLQGSPRFLSRKHSQLQVKSLLPEVFSTLFKRMYKARVSVQRSFIPRRELPLPELSARLLQRALSLCCPSDDACKLHGPFMLGYFPLTCAVHTHVFQLSSVLQCELQISRLGTSHLTQLHSM